MNIAVAGTGYVGLSIATLLAQRHEVTAVDIVPERVEKVNRREAPCPGTCQGDPFANYRGVVQGHSPADAERFES